MTTSSPTYDFIKYRRRNNLDYYHIDHAYFWRGYAQDTEIKIRLIVSGSEYQKIVMFKTIFLIVLLLLTVRDGRSISMITSMDMQGVKELVQRFLFALHQNMFYLFTIKDWRNQTLQTLKRTY